MSNGDYKVRYGFNEYEKRVIAKNGFTPESARDYVVGKLKKAKLSKEDLADFEGPVDKLTWSATSVIMEIMYRYGGKNPEPETYLKATGGDLSKHADYMAFYMYLDY